MAVLRAHQRSPTASLHAVQNLRAQPRHYTAGLGVLGDNGSPPSAIPEDDLGHFLAMLVTLAHFSDA